MLIKYHKHTLKQFGDRPHWPYGVNWVSRRNISGDMRLPESYVPTL